MSNGSQTTGYAIEALACLARRRPESMLVREIAGVRLKMPPEKLTLLRIDAAAESGRAGDAAADSARPDSFWEAFHQSYREQLAAMTLADVLAYEPDTPHAAS